MTETRANFLSQISGKDRTKGNKRDSLRHNFKFQIMYFRHNHYFDMRMHYRRNLLFPGQTSY